MIKIIIPLMLIFLMTVPAESKEKLKTYKNKKYGIELQYPSNFKVVEGKDDYWKFEYTVFIPKDKKVDGRISISYNGPQPMLYSQENSIDSFFMATAYAAPPPLMNQGKIKVGDVEGIHEVEDFGHGEMHTIRVTKNNTKYDISASWGYALDFAPSKPLPDYTQERTLILDAYQMIVSTLKFTEQSPAESGKN